MCDKHNETLSLNVEESVHLIVKHHRHDFLNIKCQDKILFLISYLSFVPLHINDNIIHINLDYSINSSLDPPVIKEVA